MTDKELFLQWFDAKYPNMLKDVNNGAVLAQILYQIAFESWQASAKREGFVLVPLQPTDEMLRLGMIESYEYSAGVEDTYKAMLSAVEEE